MEEIINDYNKGFCASCHKLIHLRGEIICQ
jgi:hypothetical protein